MKIIVLMVMFTILIMNIKKAIYKLIISIKIVIKKQNCKIFDKCKLKEKNENS